MIILWNNFLWLNIRSFNEEISLSLTGMADMIHAFKACVWHLIFPANYGVWNSIQTVACLNSQGIWNNVDRQVSNIIFLLFNSQNIESEMSNITQDLSRSTNQDIENTNRYFANDGLSNPGTSKTGRKMSNLKVSTEFLCMGKYRLTSSVTASDSAALLRSKYLQIYFFS